MVSLDPFIEAGEPHPLLTVDEADLRDALKKGAEQLMDFAGRG